MFILLNGIYKINTTKPLQSLGLEHYVKGAESIFLVDTKKHVFRAHILLKCLLSAVVRSNQVPQVLLSKVTLGGVKTK